MKTQLGKPSRNRALRLDDPFLNWVKISEGFGLPAVAVDSAEAGL